MQALMLIVQISLNLLITSWNLLNKSNIFKLWCLAILSYVIIFKECVVGDWGICYKKIPNPIVGSYFGQSFFLRYTKGSVIYQYWAW